jgi:hypothetical protein
LGNSSKGPAPLSRDCFQEKGARKSQIYKESACLNAGDLSCLIRPHSFHVSFLALFRFKVVKFTAPGVRVGPIGETILHIMVGKHLKIYFLEPLGQKNSDLHENFLTRSKIRFVKSMAPGGWMGS